MSESAGKCREIYLDHPKDKSKTCLIHGLVNSFDECKVLGYFISKYIKIRPTKDCRQDPVSRNKFNMQQENNDIVNSSVDEILLHENQKLGAAKEGPEIFSLILMIKNFIILTI